MADPQEIVDQQYARRKQEDADITAYDAYVARHPEEAQATNPTVAAQPTATATPQPDKMSMESAQHMAAAQLNPGGTAMELVNKGIDAAFDIWPKDEPHYGGVEGIKNALKLAWPFLLGAKKGPMVESAATKAEPATAKILDEFGKPMAGAEPAAPAAAPAVAESAKAVPAVQVSPFTKLSTESIKAELPTLTGEDLTAAQAEVARRGGPSLAERQIEALKTARVGERVATEFGKPEIATTISEAEALEMAKNLRLNMESVFNQPVEPPKMSAETAALAGVFHEESKGLIQTATEMLARRQAGEDVSAELPALQARFATYAVQYAKLAGVRSEAGRTLQILDPLKLENMRATETAKLAQAMSGVDPDELPNMLSKLTPDQLPRFARQAAETVEQGGSLNGTLMEYFKANLLSSPRTYVRVPVDNAVTTLAEIPVRAVAAVMPGGRGADSVQAGETLAMVRGLKDGFRESVDYARKSFRSGQPEFWIDTGTPYQGKPPQIKAATFGLEDTPLGTAIDYLGEIIRVPFRALTAAHQFGYVMATGVQEHALAWRGAVAQATQEGLEGAAGVTRATELYEASLNNRDYLEGGKDFADLVTFAKELGPTGKKLQAVANIPGVNVVVPFFKVFANMTKYGSQYLGSQMLNPWSDFYGSGANAQIARARVALGGMLAGTVAYEVARGNISGDGSYMDGSAKALARQKGWQPFSVRVAGNHWVELPEPFRFTVGIVATAAESLHHLDEPTAGQYAMAATLGVGHALTSSPIVLGLKHILDAIENPEGLTAGEAGDRLIANLAEGFVPASSLLRGIKGTIDPVQRMTAKDPTSAGFASHLEGVANNLKAQFPIASEGLEPQIDMYGDPVVRQPGVLHNMVYPVNLATEHFDEVDREVIRVQPTVQKLPKWISGRAEHVMDDPNDPDIGVALTPIEQRQWGELRGAGLKDRLAQIMAMPLYHNGSMLMKRQMLEYAISANGERATFALLKSDPTLMARYRARQMDKATALRTPEDIVPTASEGP